MTLYRFPKGKASWGVGVCIFVLLLLCRDTLITSCLVGFERSQIIVLGIMGAMFLAFLYCNRKNLKVLLRDKRAWGVVTSTVIVLLPMLVKQDWQLMYFSILICIWFAFFLSLFIDLKTVARYYVLILAALSVYSLVATYVFKPIVESGCMTVREFVNSAKLEFYNFGLAYAVKQKGYFRNFAIFREPGVYQFFIILALYLNNYCVEWKAGWKTALLNVLLFAVMVTTFSTNGIVEAVLLICVLVFEKKWYRIKAFPFIAVATMLAVCFCLLYIVHAKNAVYWILESMVNKLFNLTDSSGARLAAVQADIHMFFKHPLFGNSISEVMYAVKHNTTSTLLLFAIFGVAGGVLGALLWCGFVWNRKRNVILNLMLVAIMFMSFNTQNLIADTFFWLFPLMRWVQSEKEEKGFRPLPEGKKAKVLFVANIPSPYRVNFFNQLGTVTDLTVAFEGRAASDREKSWYSEESSAFKAIYMKGRAVNNEQFFCPGIISVIRKGYDRIILGGYASPTAMLAIAYMKMTGIPFYIEVDGGLIRTDSKPKYMLKKLLVSSADGWISSGKYPTDYLVHYGAKPEKVYRYPFSSLSDSDIAECVVSAEEKKALREKLGMGHDKVILSIGQFIPRKGFDVLMCAAAKLDSSIGIYIVGGKPTEEYLKMKEDLNLQNICFEGFKSKAELAEYYRAADLFVLPTREDIWGLVINEAMAYGLPVITTNQCVAGLELVEDGVNGYIVPVEDHEALTEKINAVFAAFPSQMGMASLKKIRPYTIENMVRAHQDILNHGR